MRNNQTRSAVALYKAHFSPGCSCDSTPGLSGVWDEVAKGFGGLAKPVEEKLTKLEIAIKAILFFSAAAAVASTTNLFLSSRRR
jgi:hypothetical protein